MKRMYMVTTVQPNGSLYTLSFTVWEAREKQAAFYSQLGWPFVCIDDVQIDDEIKRM